MSALLILGILFLLFAATVTLVLLVVGPSVLLQPRRRTAEFYRQLGKPTTPAEAGLPCDSVTLKTTDGLNLSCWFIRSCGTPKGTLVYLHGVADCKIDGIRFAKLFHTLGYNVMLYDARRHGDSGGKFCTYGFYEKYDVVTVIDYLSHRRDTTPGRIGIFGTSMGAAVALQAAAIDRRIAAVAAENSFATLRSVFDDYQKRMIKLPFHYLRNLVIVRSEFMATFKATDVSPVDALRSIRIPILIIYGSDDRRIRPQYSAMLFERANDPKVLFAVEGAGHTDLWEIGDGRYEERLISFFGKVLS